MNEIEYGKHVKWQRFDHSVYLACCKGSLNPSIPTHNIDVFSPFRPRQVFCQLRASVSVLQGGVCSGRLHGAIVQV